MRQIVADAKHRMRELMLATASLNSRRSQTTLRQPERRLCRQPRLGRPRSRPRLQSRRPRLGLARLRLGALRFAVSNRRHEQCSRHRGRKCRRRWLPTRRRWKCHRWQRHPARRRRHRRAIFQRWSSRFRHWRHGRIRRHAEQRRAGNRSQARRFRPRGHGRWIDDRRPWSRQREPHGRRPKDPSERHREFRHRPGNAVRRQGWPGERTERRPGQWSAFRGRHPVGRARRPIRHTRRQSRLDWRPRKCAKSGRGRAQRQRCSSRRGHAQHGRRLRCFQQRRGKLVGN